MTRGPRERAVAWLAVSAALLAALPALAAPARAATTYVSSTDPYNGELNVNVSTPIVVWFSGPMDPGSVVWTIDPAIALDANWSGGDRVLTLTHAAPFRECARYTVSVAGNDVDGDPLVPTAVPNPFWFGSESGRACIYRTSPANGERNVGPWSQVVVFFSAPVDHLTIPIRLDIVPDPGAYAIAWSIPATVLTTSLIYPLPDCGAFTVTVSDPAGPVPGLVPNPWWFTTTCPSPYILWTVPADGATGVPVGTDIGVVFSEGMNPATVGVTIWPQVILDPSWIDAATLRLTHVAPFLRCTQYAVEVISPDLAPGLAPNPWSFTTACSVPASPENLTTEAGNARVQLAWSPPADDGGLPVIGYAVFRGTAPDAVIRLADLANILTYEDGTARNFRTYFYRVSALNAWGEGPWSEPVAATPENLEPTVAIAAPAPGATVSGTVTISGSAADADGTVERVELRIDGGAWHTAQSTESWSFAWDTSLYPGGAHTIEARAWDGENASDLARVDVVVSNARPPDGGPVVVDPRAVGVALGVGIAAVVGAAVLLLRRRNRRPPATQR